MHKYVNMRKKLFYAMVRPHVPEGCMLPTWALALRWLLFPLDTTYWVLGRSRGYQYDRDIWLIDGVRYAGAALHMLANAQGETYRISRTGDVVTLERVHNAELTG